MAAEDRKISQIGRQLPLLTDVVVAARDNTGNKINITFTLADILASITGSPFKITNEDESYATVQDTTDPDNVITNTVITDGRLVGKSGYPVYSTQTNTEFRNEDIVYNASLGKVTIKNFELTEGEHISIYPTSAANNIGATYQDLLDEINDLKDEVDLAKQAIQLQQDTLGLLETIQAPLKDSILWFNKPANLIPQGWVEATDWRGKTGIHLNPDDIDFNELGKVGGSKTFTISQNNLPAVGIGVQVPKSATAIDASGSGRFAMGGGGNEPVAGPTLTTNNLGSGTAIKFLPSYKIVLFIKYVGLT